MAIELEICKLLDGTPFDENKFIKTVNQISDQIDAVFNRTYTATAVIGALDDLDKLNSAFVEAWQFNSKQIFQLLGVTRVKEILSYFSHSRVCTWAFEEYDFYLKLPDEITIYRGGNGGVEDVLMGFSWSLYLNVAHQFACTHENGLVISAEVNKDDIIFVSLLEFEVVPRIGSISKVRVIRDPDTEFAPIIKFKEVIY